MPAQRHLMDERIARGPIRVSVRAVPSIVAESGMTLVAVPALNMPIVTTAESVGSISRLTNC